MDDSREFESSTPEAHNSPQQVPGSSPSTAGEKITLQVGERLFVTRRETLTQESGFFASLLSTRWENAQADGSYFIDADPRLFEHILNYLRRGVFPVFYDKLRGYDHALYRALLEEARYFQIGQLENWISDNSYLQQVKIMHSAEVVEDTSLLQAMWDTNTEVEYHPVWRNEKVYICPRGIFNHKGNLSACGRQCMKVQGDAENEYEDKES